MKLWLVLWSLTLSIPSFASAKGEIGDTKPAGPTGTLWTPERVRDFVLRVEREMEALGIQQARTDGKRLPVVGVCRGEGVEMVIKKSEAVRRVRAVIAEPALSCYLTTYLGCDLGAWIGRSSVSLWGPSIRPFTLSNVTIVEQTESRVVADVQEIAFEQVENGIAGDWTATEHPHPYTANVLASYPNDGSRYTIVRGADSVWRVSDRKPGDSWWEWLDCRSQHLP